LRPYVDGDAHQHLHVPAPAQPPDRPRGDGFLEIPMEWPEPPPPKDDLESGWTVPPWFTAGGMATAETAEMATVDADGPSGYGWPRAFADAGERPVRDAVTEPLPVSDPTPASEESDDAYDELCIGTSAQLAAAGVPKVVPARVVEGAQQLFEAGGWGAWSSRVSRHATQGREPRTAFRVRPPGEDPDQPAAQESTDSKNDV
jgi:hypothetical protein